MEKCNNLNELAIKVSSLPDPPDTVSLAKVVVVDFFLATTGIVFVTSFGGGGKVYFWDMKQLEA